MAVEGNSIGNLVSEGDGNQEIPDAMWEDWEDGGSQNDSQVVPGEFRDNSDSGHDKGAEDHLISADQWEEWEYNEEDDKAKDKNGVSHGNTATPSFGEAISGQTQAREVNIPKTRYSLSSSSPVSRQVTP